MAIRSSLFVQNSGPTGVIDVEEARVGIGALVTPMTSALKAKSGFRPAGGTSPGLVTATGTPDANVHVAPFQLLLQGGRSSTPGVYVCCADAQVDINVLSTPADPTNPRDDLIVAQQSDTFYGDGNSDFVVRHVVGTPSGSPADPAVTGSGDYITLARVRVDANATTITAAKITDLRTGGHANSLAGGLYSVASGGILPVATLAQRDALTSLYPGRPVWRVDTDDMEVYNGSAWVTASGRAAWTPYTATMSSTGTQPSIGNSVVIARHLLRGKTCRVDYNVVIGSTFAPGTGNYSWLLPFTMRDVNQGVGSAYIADAGTANYGGVIVISTSTTTIGLYLSGTGNNVSATNPMAPATNDMYRWSFEYEIA